MPIVFALTIFWSALLLFVVQPLFARLVLPLLGGAPAVWNTALVFYQAMLLAGYAYAHVVASRFKPRQQVLIHLTVLLLPLLVLPFGVPAGWEPPRADSPIVWLLGLLFVAVGLPFFVVSASSPLLQSWFGRSGSRGAENPYVLYAASNAGSMIALLSYPLLIEPNTTLRWQRLMWAFGYGGLIVLFALCGWLLWRSPARAVEATAQAHTPISWRRKLLWIALAAVPSSLLVSVTSYLSTDLAAIPLLWVVPLAIYLLTFIFVFAQRQVLSQRWLVWLMPLLVISLALTLAANITRPLLLILLLHLVALFVITMVLHGRLAADRPEPAQLTEFYLLMSLGGVLGGMFNAFIAPNVFNAIVEYPLTLVLACMLMPWRSALPTSARAWRQLLTTPVVIGAIALVLVVLTQRLPINGTVWGVVLMFGVPLGLSLLLVRKPLSLGLAVALILLVHGASNSGQTVYAERSFFGVNRVTLAFREGYHVLFHGTTIHGIQDYAGANAHEPLTYYARSGPIGQVLTAINRQQTAQTIGVVGLGAGSLACYRQPQQQWIYYEIDPSVEKIARDPQFFTYLNDCTPDAPIELGDARLSLQQPSPPFDLLVLDAYSSDAIPVHLLTREAVALYRERLKPNGILAFHITNRHFDLEPVLHDLAVDAGWQALVWEDRPISDADAALGKAPSTWAILTQDQATFAKLQLGTQWRALHDNPNDRLWTDDYSSIVTTLR